MTKPPAGMDDEDRDSHAVPHRQPEAVTLSWAFGALATIVLALLHLPAALAADLVSGGAPWAFLLVATLLVQAGLCLAFAVGWLMGRRLLFLAAMIVLTGAQLGAAGLAWPAYAAPEWMLWIGPLPMLAPGLIHAAAGSARGTRSP